MTAFPNRVTNCDMRNSTIAERVGDRLRQAREAAGFDTAAAFARELGIDGQAYRSYERGEREMPFELIVQLRAYDIHPNDLFPCRERVRVRRAMRIERRSAA